MKKFFATIVALIGTLAAQAYDFPYLILQSADGNTQAVSVESLTITFADGQLVAVNDNGSQIFTLTDLNKMFFSNSGDATGISTMESVGESVEAFTLGGLSLGKFSSMVEAKRSLKAGVYVLRSKNKTVKIAIK
jgi:hypothetical protein